MIICTDPLEPRPDLRAEADPGPSIVEKINVCGDHRPYMSQEEVGPAVSRVEK